MKIGDPFCPAEFCIYLARCSVIILLLELLLLYDNLYGTMALIITGAFSIWCRRLDDVSVTSWWWHHCLCSMHKLCTELLHEGAMEYNSVASLEWQPISFGIGSVSFGSPVTSVHLCLTCTNTWASLSDSSILMAATYLAILAASYNINYNLKQYIKLLAFLDLSFMTRLPGSTSECSLT